MPEEPPFSELMARLRQGDDEAARRIFQRFAHRLIALARSRLDARVRQKVDPEDVLQSALGSFFRRQAVGEWELDNWDSLWSLLTVITLRKCGHRVEYFRAACRDVQRELSPPTVTDGESAVSWQGIARDPTPAEAAMLAETVEHLMRSLDERDRRILELSLRQEPVPQISAEVGCTERTVRRVLERVRKRLERQRADAAEGP
jgi:RNA polymerase sigma-70 factor (ECF subfamily)